jgi:hypothetical protein
LANELLAMRLAEAAGLPVPPTEVVEVGDWLVENSSDLNIQLSGSVIPCQPGLQFGSRYVVDPLQGQIFDYFPATMLERVRNLGTFAGMLVLDKWTANSNGKQGRTRELIRCLLDRGAKIRELIIAFRMSSRQPFPNWKEDA